MKKKMHAFCIKIDCLEVREKYINIVNISRNGGKAIVLLKGLTELIANNKPPDRRI